MSNLSKLLEIGVIGTALVFNGCARKESVEKVELEGKIMGWDIRNNPNTRRDFYSFDVDFGDKGRKELLVDHYSPREYANSPPLKVGDTFKVNVDKRMLPYDTFIVRSEDVSH